MTAQFLYIGDTSINFVTDTRITTHTKDGGKIRDKEVRKYWHDPVLNAIVYCYGNGFLFSAVSADLQQTEASHETMEGLFTQIERLLGTYVPQYPLHFKRPLEPDTAVTVFGFEEGKPFAVRWWIKNGALQPREKLNTKVYDYLPKAPSIIPNDDLPPDDFIVQALQCIKDDYEHDPHIGGHMIVVEMTLDGVKIERKNFR